MVLGCSGRIFCLFSVLSVGFKECWVDFSTERVAWARLGFFIALNALVESPALMPGRTSHEGNRDLEFGARAGRANGLGVQLLLVSPALSKSTHDLPT